MTKVDQTIVDKGDGDCMRACVASILDLDLIAVPHFMRIPEGKWSVVMSNFFWALGYDFVCTGYPKSPEKERGHVLSESPNINGYVMASVPSRTFEDVSHSVIMDLNGLIVNDPNPNKKWEGVNVLESGDLENWNMFELKKELNSDDRIVSMEAIREIVETEENNGIEFDIDWCSVEHFVINDKDEYIGVDEDNKEITKLHISAKQIRS